MPLIEALPVGADTAQWPVWGTTARIVVTDPGSLPAARRLVQADLAAVDRACSRFRPDSEIRRVERAGGRPVRVSPLLAELIAVALAAAERTGGDVDPTAGPGLRRGDRRDVRLDGRTLTVPAGVSLDLGATGKAHAADRCARLVAAACGVGVLVGLGGDIATAGPAPEGGWRVLVQDRPGDPSCTIALASGAALATSSTVSRSWRENGRMLHHILDPRTCRPAPPVWRTVSVAAARCADANSLTTAAVVRGRSAETWLRELGVPARLVTADRRVRLVGSWPRAT